MSTQRSAPPSRRAPSRKLRRRERLQLSMQHPTHGPRPPLPRWGPESERDDADAADEQSAHLPLASVNRAGLWVGGILTRVGEHQREHPFWSPWLATILRLFPRRSPFSWRERDWRGSAWGRRARVVPAVAAVLIALLVAGTFAITLATRAAGLAGTAETKINLPVATAPSGSVGNILRPVPAAATATPNAPQYMVGVWTSSASPPAGGSVKVFVRVSQGVAPAAHIRVSLWVDFPGYSRGFGPATTDADGVATITVTYGSLPTNQPVFVTANATIGRQTVSGQTTFVPQ